MSVEGSGVGMSVYCIQTDAIQRYSVNPAKYFPPMVEPSPSDDGSAVSEVLETSVESLVRYASLFYLFYIY